MTTNAIILLAGMGSRLKPLTNTTHKALIKIGDKTILERQVTQLIQNGITDFHFVLGYRADDIQNFITENFPRLRAHFYPNPIFADTNTGYSLLLVLRTLQESFLLLDGDVVMSDALVEKLCSTRADTWVRPYGDSILLCETDPAKLDAEAVKVQIPPPSAPPFWRVAPDMPCGMSKRNARGAGVPISAIGKHIPLTEAAGESIGVGLYQTDWAVALKEQLEIAMQDPHKKKTWYYEDVMNVILNPVGATGRSPLPTPPRILSTGTEPWVEVDDFNDLERAKKLFF